MFGNFYITFGLYANKSEYELFLVALFLVGLSQPTKERIVESMSLPLVSLPAKYLRVLLTSKCLSDADCDTLTNKMIAHLKLWYYKNLSYVGRF